MAKRPKPFSDDYETVVKADSIKQAKDIIDKWFVFGKFRTGRDTNIILLDGFIYPRYFYLNNLKTKNYGGSIWAADNGEYARQRNYKPLTYNELIETYFYKAPKSVKQLNFESENDMKVIDKIKKYLSIYKIEIEPYDNMEYDGHIEIEDKGYNLIIKKKGKELVNKGGFKTNAEAQLWADNFIRKQTNINEMDAGHDDYFEIKRLERELEILKKQKKETMKNDLKDEFDWTKIDNKIKKIEDRLRYIKK